MINPVTFEVLRHRLSTIVEEGAAILRNISGSSSVAQSNDCNVAILAANGDGVVIGRYIASHAIACIRTTRYVRAEFRENPGIGPDDMFFTNHPYIGTPHQCCGALVAPIFVGDEIVAWTGVGIHFGDVGGTTPGQVSIGAQSIWSEAMPMPPIKIVERGVLRKDIEEDFLIRSRTRVQNAVDLRAMVGSLNAVKRRTVELVERYGGETFKEALQRVILSAETKFRAILREIPDGSWSTENYLDYFDNHRLDAYVCRLTLSKRGDALTFDFTKSSQQAPAVINATIGTTESWVVRVLLGFFGFAVTRCPAAVLNVLTIETTPGTITDCRWPAGVCKGTTSVSQSVWHAAIHCVGQMLLTSEKYAERSAAVSRGLITGVDLQGNDQYGAPFAAVLGDTANAAGSAAKSGGDGIDTGGSFDAEVSTPNVESNEARYPVLYLYRRQRIDGGGAGKFRGGVGVSMALIPHDVERIPNVMIHSHGVTFPTASGLSGGYPGALNHLTIERRTNIRELFARGMMPADLSEIAAEEGETPPPFSYTALTASDVYAAVGGGGGGYGDPLDRDPQLVSRDVIKGLVSPAEAKARYGVLLDPVTSHVDAPSTLAQRTLLRTDRQSAAQPPEIASVLPNGRGTTRGAPINLYLEIDHRPGGDVVRCRCGAALTKASDDYRAALALRESSMTADVLSTDSSVRIPAYTIRERFCPSCWTLVDTEVFVAQTMP